MSLSFILCKDILWVIIYWCNVDSSLTWICYKSILCWKRSHRTRSPYLTSSNKKSRTPKDTHAHMHHLSTIHSSRWEYWGRDCRTMNWCKTVQASAYVYITSIAARGGGGSFKRLKLYNSEEHVPIESFGTTLIHWTFFLMTRTKLAFVGFVAAGNSMWHQVLDDLCLVVTDQSATTWDSSYAPNSTQYNSVLQSFEKCYPSTILYYKVLLQKVLLQYYSVLQSTTPVLLRTTKYYSSTTPVLQSTSPVLLRTTKYYSSTTKDYSSTTKYYSSTTPVLLRTTKYYSSTTSYYKVLVQYYKVLLRTTNYCSSTTKC